MLHSASSSWDTLVHLTSLTVRVQDSNLVDVILGSRLGQQLTDLSILVKPMSAVTNDNDLVPPSAWPVQINLYQICLLAPNLKQLKIDMPQNYSRGDRTGGGQTSVIYNTAYKPPTLLQTAAAAAARCNASVSSVCSLEKAGFIFGQNVWGVLRGH